MSAPVRRLEIRVDEVVVRGLSTAQARSAVAALEARLQVLGEGWASATATTAIAPRDEAFRRASVVTPPTRNPNAIGESAASAVWSTIAGGGRR
jgi:hypothetical protein